MTAKRCKKIEKIRCGDDLSRTFGDPTMLACRGWNRPRPPQFGHSWTVKLGMTNPGRKIIGAVVAILVAMGSVQAQQPPPKDTMPERAEKAIKEGVQTILRALETMFKTIPQYEAPEVLENGDIIIRRKKPKEKQPPDDTDST